MLGAAWGVFAAACAPTEDVPSRGEEVWTYWDGYTTPFYPYLFNMNDADVDPLRLPLDQVSLVTWPELEPVQTTPTERVIDPLDERAGPQHLSTHIIEFVPTEPLADRWYAIRWYAESVPPLVLLDGIPLGDGSVVWRVPGRFFPEAEVVDAQYYAGDPHDVVVVFTADVRPTSCASPDGWVVIEQGDLRCDATCPAGGTGYGRGWSAPCPALDRAEPFRARLPEGAAVGRGGEAVPAFDLEVLVRVEVPRRRPAPVPAALCAGVACE